MNIWKDLLKMALLGTERGSLSEATQRELQEQGLGVNVSPEQQILEGVAYFRQLKKVAFQLEENQSAIPEIVEEEEDYLSAKASRNLAQIVDGTYENALKEFIWYARKANRVLAPESLPELFYKALSDQAIWQYMKPLIGARGHWLLQLNPDWKRLRTSADVENWALGTTEERQAILRYVRAHAPLQAIELLDSTWSKEAFGNKKEFLQILKQNLNIDDEPFLMKCLSDGRKEIRKNAAELLIHIKDSGYQNRMMERAKVWIKLSEDGGIDVDIPIELDEQTKIDFRIKSKTSWEDWRKNSPWGILVSHLPPSIWEEHFGKTPIECVRIFFKTYRWRIILMLFLMQATILYKDERWMMAILNFSREAESEQPWSGKQGKEFMKQIPNSIFNEFVLKQLSTGQKIIPEDSLASYMLCQGDQFWSDKVTMLLFMRFQDWMARAASNDWSTFHYRRILEVAAYRANPNLYDQLKSSWPYRSKLWFRWEREVEKMLKVLSFRKEMIAALK